MSLLQEAGNWLSGNVPAAQALGSESNPQQLCEGRVWKTPVTIATDGSSQRDIW